MAGLHRVSIVDDQFVKSEFVSNDLEVIRINCSDHHTKQLGLDPSKYVAVAVSMSGDVRSRGGLPRYLIFRHGYPVIYMAKENHKLVSKYPYYKWEYEYLVKTQEGWLPIHSTPQEKWLNIDHL